jgi:hypothetical protein
MKIDLDNLHALIAKETRRVISESTDLELVADEEKKRQKQLAKSVDDLDLKAEEGVDEIKEQEDDEEETGVPETIDDTEGSQKDRTGGKGTKDSPKLDTPGQKQLQSPSVGAVIDKLNALRGGRSLKDAEVKKSFSQYFKNLTSSERTSLLAFLTGMSQILAGVSSGTQALDPGDVGVRVKSIRKAPEKPKHNSGKKQVGTDAQPIIVGESRCNVKTTKYMYKVRK